MELLLACRVCGRISEVNDVKDTCRCGALMIPIDMRPAESIVRTLDQYTDEEMIAGFKGIHGHALGIYEDVKQNGNSGKDTSHWCYEAMMNLLAPNHKGGESEFWAAFNKMNDGGE